MLKLLQKLLVGVGVKLPINLSLNRLGRGIGIFDEASGHCRAYALTKLRRVCNDRRPAQMLRAGRCVFEEHGGLICGHPPNDLRRTIYCCKDRLIRSLKKIGWVRSIQIEKRRLRAVAVGVSAETTHVGPRLTAAKARDQFIGSEAFKLCLHTRFVVVVD